RTATQGCAMRPPNQRKAKGSLDELQTAAARGLSLWHERISRRKLNGRRGLVNILVRVVRALGVEHVVDNDLVLRLQASREPRHRIEGLQQCGVVGPRNVLP